MKKLHTSYTFTPSTRKVALNGLGSLSLAQMLLITNVTTNQIIYNFANPDLGATISGTELTLDFNTTGMSGTDKLQIFFDDLVQPATELTLSAVLAAMPTNPAQRLSRRSAFDSGNSYLYIGTAAYGTAEGDSGWTVVRLTLSASGSVSSKVSGTGSWTGRASITYA
jgi:hypothetical protein